MTDWLNISLKTHDLRTSEGRDGLREAVNKVGEAKNAIVASIAKEIPPIFMSYTLGYVPDGKASDGSEGLEGILVVFSEQIDPKMIGSSGGLINDLTEKTSTFIAIAEQMYSKGVVDASYLRDFPAYVKIIEEHPLMGISVKISSRPIELEIS